jgi:hypothetical protein
VSGGEEAWTAGRWAWERLTTWQHGAAQVPAHGPEVGEALQALVDIGVVRQLLDQAELMAVRAARLQGRSWAEIATRLGVSRQSAWERWRDLDAAGPATTSSGGPGAGAAADVPAAAAAELVDRRAREARRRSTVVVPNVIGRSWDAAGQLLLAKRLVVTSADPDEPPLAELGWPNVVVADQSPESGAKVPSGSPVTLWLWRGGGSAGVREPRRPKPSPRSGQEIRSETTEEAVG